MPTQEYGTQRLNVHWFLEHHGLENHLRFVLAERLRQWSDSEYTPPSNSTLRRNKPKLYSLSPIGLYGLCDFEWLPHHDEPHN